MPHAHDASGRFYQDDRRNAERDTYPRRRARTGTEVRAHREGRECYRLGIMSADDLCECPPYPVGGPLSIAFWQGWHDERDGDTIAQAFITTEV